MFEDDDRIIAREIQITSYYNIEYQWDTLRKWTGMKRIKELIFDSNKHNWSVNTSEFDEKLLGKDHLLFIITTEINNQEITFGGYLSERIDQTICFIGDSNAFVFTFMDNIPLKCEILKEESFNAFTLCSKYVPALFSFGNRNIHFFKQDHLSRCYQNCPQSFNYHNKENALIGNDSFIPKRLYVLQLE